MVVRFRSYYRKTTQYKEKVQSHEDFNPTYNSSCPRKLHQKKKNSQQELRYQSEIKVDGVCQSDYQESSVTPKLNISRTILYYNQETILKLRPFMLLSHTRSSME